MGNKAGTKQNRAVSMREEVFCQAMCAIGTKTFSNATKSKELAKYSDKTMGSVVFNKPYIRERINKILAELFIKLDLTPEKILLGIMSDQKSARDVGKFSVSNACSRLLGETYAMFSEKLYIAEHLVVVEAPKLSDAERTASIESAKVYKLLMAGMISDDGVIGQERVGIKQARSKPAKFTPSIDVTPEPVEVKEEPEPVKAMNDLVKKQETIEETERIPAGMVGKGPRFNKSGHSVSDWK